MPGWDDGYVSDVVYTSNFHRETTPAWLVAAALLLGHRPPDLTRPFRYADLGCGHGLTATIVAATCPHAEVWGFDFNPAHVESARELALRAGLTNLRFQEASFAELAAMDEAALPEFDFIVAHGVMSWVSLANQQHLIETIGRRLRAGGLSYLSYNVATGWGAMPPVRALMRLLMQATHDRSDLSATGVLDYLDTMKQAGAGFFAANPTLEPRLAEIRRQDPRYIAHEFLNRDWHPLMFADVSDRMEAVKCSYIGSATLAENIDIVSLPQGMQGLVAKTPNLALRETVRDFASVQAFRRDIYRRGSAAVPGPETTRLLDSLTFEWLGREVADPINLPTPLGTLAGLPEVYGPLVAILMSETRTLGEIRRDPALSGRPLPELLQAVTLLMAGGYVHPALPTAVQTAGREGSQRLNAVIGEMNGNGFDIGWLASPAIGSALKTDLLETLFVHARACGPTVEPNDLTERLVASLIQAGRSVQRDGQAVTDAMQLRTILRQAVQTILESRQPLLQRLGVIATQQDELHMAQTEGEIQPTS
jgi:SAM-dependent methyltransferase